MKIAFVTQPWDEVSPGIGGHSSIPILTYQFAHRLPESSEVIIYAKREHSQKQAERDDAGIHYRRMSIDAEYWLLKPFKLLDRLPKFRNPHRALFTSSFYYLGYALQVAHDLRKHRPDIVHIHNFSQFVPVIRAFNPQCKIALHMHCEWLTQIDKAVVGPRLCKTDSVIGCSEYITEKVRRRFPQFASRCQTVFNGVDTDLFTGRSEPSVSQENNTKRLLFVGRVSPEKGVHVLLDAFQQVVKRLPDAELDVIGPVGSAPFEFVIPLSDDSKVSNLASFYGRNIRLQGTHYLSHLRAKLGSDAAKRVFFYGSVPHARLVDFYRKADVLVFPSVWNEPFGMPLIEAMASEVPTVATRGGGVTEIVDEGKTGLLVERGNAAVLAEAICYLLENNSLRKSMGKAGRKRVLELFSWNELARNLSNIYHRLCESNHGQAYRSVSHARSADH